MLNTLKGESDLLDSDYKTYYTEFTKVYEDVTSIMQIFFTELLKAGTHVIEKKYHKDDTCPLCLQPKSKSELLQDIEKRLKEIEESSKKKTAFDFAKQSIIKISEEPLAT